MLTPAAAARASVLIVSAAAVTQLVVRIYRATGRRSLAYLEKQKPLRKGASYFLSGVMGGSGGGTTSLAGIPVESQSYRSEIRATILQVDSSAHVVDPAEYVETRAPALHPPRTPQSEFWSTNASVRTMFGECVAQAAKADVIVSYLPTASMGSAVELHAAQQTGRLILVIAPGEMGNNWVVRSFADVVFHDTEGLRSWLQTRLQPFGKAISTVPANVNGSVTFLYSNNLEASKKFYLEGLGLPIRADKGAVVFFSLPGSAASLGVVEHGVSAASSPPCSASDAGRDTVMLCLLTDDVDGCYARSLSHGGGAEQPPRANQRFGIYSALLRDPDGYLVEVQQFLDPKEQQLFTGQ